MDECLALPEAGSENEFKLVIRLFFAWLIH
jgi:hypothetical protein